MGQMKAGLSKQANRVQTGRTRIDEQVDKGPSGPNKDERTRMGGQADRGPNGGRGWTDGKDKYSDG